MVVFQCCFALLWPMLARSPLVAGLGYVLDVRKRLPSQVSIFEMCLGPMVLMSTASQTTVANPKSGQLPKFRAQGRELLENDDEALARWAMPRWDEVVSTFPDFVWVIGEDGWQLLAGSVVDAPRDGRVVNGRMLDPISEALFEFVHNCAIASYVRRFRSRRWAITSATFSKSWVARGPIASLMMAPREANMGDAMLRDEKPRFASVTLQQLSVSAQLQSLDVHVGLSRASASGKCASTVVPCG